jgi:hypothetical protein
MEPVRGEHINSLSDYFNLIGGDAKRTMTNTKAVKLLSRIYADLVILRAEATLKHDKHPHGFISYTARQKTKAELFLERQEKPTPKLTPSSSYPEIK